jgi:AcrR family transcriptional regulator
VGDLHAQLGDWRRHNDRLTKAFESAYRQARESGEIAECVAPRAAAVETMMFFSGLVRLWLLDDRRDGLRKHAKAAIKTHLRGRATR